MPVRLRLLLCRRRGARGLERRNLLKRWSVTTAMTKPRPLALSRERLALVQQGAKGVPPEWHDRFVDAVADELLLLDNITDADVNHAVTVVLLRIVMAV